MTRKIPNCICHSDIMPRGAEFEPLKRVDVGHYLIVQDINVKTHNSTVTIEKTHTYHDLSLKLNFCPECGEAYVEVACE